MSYMYASERGKTPVTADCTDRPQVVVLPGDNTKSPALSRALRSEMREFDLECLKDGKRRFQEKVPRLCSQHRRADIESVRIIGEMALLRLRSEFVEPLGFE